MKAEPTLPQAAGAFTVVLLLALAGAFVAGVWGRPSPRVMLPPTPREFTNTTTVRLSAAELIKSGADVSGLDCHACHNEKEKPPQVHFDAAGNVVLPEAHQDLVFSRMNCAGCHPADAAFEMKFTAEGKTIIPKAHEGAGLRHGRNNRNDNCFNCHDQANLTQLHTAGGRSLKLEEAPLLCASCHGPTYRDWEAGMHGRTSGSWVTNSKERERKGCTSCHDPHSPAFPEMRPGPGPRSPKVASEASHETANP